MFKVLGNQRVQPSAYINWKGGLQIVFFFSNTFPFVLWLAQFCMCAVIWSLLLLYGFVLIVLVVVQNVCVAEEMENDGKGFVSVPDD